MPKIFRDQKEILIVKSGVAIMPPGANAITFQVSNLSFDFLFQTNKTGEQKFEIRDSSPTSARFKLLNFDESLGTSFEVGLGSLNDQPLRLMMIVRAIGDGRLRSREISYSFYHGEEP